MRGIAVAAALSAASCSDTAPTPADAAQVDASTSDAVTDVSHDVFTPQDVIPPMIPPQDVLTPQDVIPPMIPPQDSAVDAEVITPMPPPMPPPVDAGVIPPMPAPIDGGR